MIAWVAGGVCLLIGLGVWLYHPGAEYIAEDSRTIGPCTEHERVKEQEKAIVDHWARIGLTGQSGPESPDYYGRFKGPKD